MTLSSSLTGIAAAPRSRFSRLSMVVMIIALASFLIAASFCLISYPVAITSQMYFQGDHFKEPPSESANEEQTEFVVSVREARRDIVIKEPVSGFEVTGGSESGAELSSTGREEVRMGNGSEVKGDSESGTDLSSEGKKDVEMGNGSEVRSDHKLSSNGGTDVEMGNGSEVKSNLESGVYEVRSGLASGSDLSSKERKGIGTGDVSELKAGPASGSVLSFNGRGDVQRGDGYISLHRNGGINAGGNLALGFKNESEKVSSGSPDDGSAPLDATQEVLTTSASGINSEMATAKSCDLYQGIWIYDPAGPLYTNNTCPIITQMQNCQGNLRPDKDYENYRWKPDQCDIPRFSPRRFLELMRGKTLAFIGDSVARNQMESMLCILWQEETPKNRGNRHMQRWYFRSTSTMIIRIWSSWLVHQTPEAVDYAPEGVTKVHLDIPDETFMEFLPSFDVVVLSSGHWFAKQSAYILNNKVVGGQLWWPKGAGNMKINNIEAFGISVETAMTAIANNPNFTGLAIVRSYSPDHYEGGAWNTGGSCTGKVKPASEVLRNGFTDAMHEKQTTGFQRAVARSGSGGSKLKFMDITEVFGYRSDGHPGPYRNPDPNKITKRGPHGEPPPQDCLHWCMPGPVDTWNEILLEIIRREYEGA